MQKIDIVFSHHALDERIKERMGRPTLSRYVLKWHVRNQIVLIGRSEGFARKSQRTLQVRLWGKTWPIVVERVSRSKFVIITVLPCEAAHLGHQSTIGDLHPQIEAMRDLLK